jgi:hypothetical protein
MSEIGEDFKALRQRRREDRIECPRCLERFKNRSASKLMPGRTCRWCGYVDPRPRT